MHSFIAFVQVGVLCSVPTQNGWYRAVTLAYEPDQDEVVVRFIDYAGFARLPRANLRQMHADYVTLPLQMQQTAASAIGYCHQQTTTNMMQSVVGQSVSIQ